GGKHTHGCDCKLRRCQEVSQQIRRRRDRDPDGGWYCGGRKREHEGSRRGGDAVDDINEAQDASGGGRGHGCRPVITSVASVSFDEGNGEQQPSTDRHDRFGVASRSGLVLESWIQQGISWSYFSQLCQLPTG